MLSLAKARKDYYLQKVGEISPREDYYLRGGTASGSWHGSGAAEMGIDGAVTAEGLVRLFDGQHPDTGEQFGHRLRKDGVAAWDLTFSADKSVSLLWAFGDDETRKHVVEAFEEATAEAVSYMESVASSTRGASRTPVLDDDGVPVLDEDGMPRQRIETWPIRTEGYVSAWFTEFTSRADDPQLHTHVVVGNRVKGVDGVWRAIDGRLLYRHQLAAGYLHEAELRSRLTERLGVRWQPVHNGMADIEGFTREQVMAFSQRRQKIETWRDAHGIADTPAGNEVATLATRSPKQERPLETLMPQWLERAAEVGITPEAVAAVCNRGREVTILDPEPLFDHLASAEGLTAQASTFGRSDVLASTAESLPEGGKRPDLEITVDAFLHRSDVIPILPIHAGADNAIDLPTGISSIDQERLRDLEYSTRAAQVMRRSDGGTFPGLVHERRYTTTELLAIEQRIIDRAVDGVGSNRWAVSMGKVDEALQRHPMLTEEQREMVRQFATSGNAIDIGVGAAGTGKTTVMAILGELAEETNTPVVGAALAARTAAGFQAATDIRSSTLTRFLGEAKTTGGLPNGVVVIVDEAGMVGSRQLAETSDLVDAASGKLILIGDHHQLAEIDAGGLYRALTIRLPAVELTENVRQEQEWERTALTELRDGSIERAVAMYDRRGKIIVGDDTDDTINQAVDNWYRDVQDVGDPADVLLIGHRNATVDQLNKRARTIVAETGHLEGPVLDVGDRVFQAGDRVVCLKNRPRLGVLNGDLGTVFEVDTERRAVTISLDRTSDTVTVPDWYLDDGHLDWGYALTGHKAQGATARRAHTVAGDGVDREWIYVTMSRGRETNTIYLADPQHDHNDCTHLTHQHPDRIPALIAALGRTAAEPAALDTGRGPRVEADERLAQRLSEVKAALGNPEGGRRSSVGGRDGGEHLVDYLNLHDEVQNRHRDRFAPVAYQPPEWITDTLGERPADHNRRAAWDAVVDRVLRYRTDQEIPDEASELLGAQPPSSDIDKRVAWIAARRAIEGDLRHLISQESPEPAAIGR
ncbi:MAG: relaxase domain-containing protein [Actinomycetia bacterium]|nr:relaxase domain-containing protein [Actinomycetes bacterium]